MRTIFIGSRGNEVKLLQHELGLKVDGSFGPLTFKSLKVYQAQRAMNADGICGAKTWRMLLSRNKINCLQSDVYFNVVRVRISDVKLKLVYNPSPVSIRQVAALHKPDFIMNAGMYNNAPSKPGYGLTIVDTIMDGKLVGGGNFAPVGLGFGPTRAEICSTGYAKQNHPFFIGFSPDLYPEMNMKGLSPAFLDGIAYRTGVGTKGDELYFITTNVPMSLRAFRNKFTEIGCDKIGNFDGGGSTQAAFIKYGLHIPMTNQSDSRKNATYLMFNVR